MSGNSMVNISVGSQMAPGEAVDWQPPVPFTPGVDRKVDVRKTGNHVAVKFESNDDQEWSLSGYDVEFVQTAKR